MTKTPLGTWLKYLYATVGFDTAAPLTLYAGGSAPACGKMWSNSVVLEIPSTANAHLSASSYALWSAGNRLRLGMGSREHMHHIRGTGGIGKEHLL